MKAVLLYPMNALAADQAMRINDFLTRPELKNVTAGLYIGEAPDTSYPKVLTERAEIRSQRPDILITNYKMLDLLLQRGDDLALWHDADAWPPPRTTRSPASLSETSARSRHPPRWGRAGTRHGSGRSPSRSSAPRSTKAR